jgi:CRP-like cAMP-binding protein
MVKELESILKESFIFGGFPSEEISRLAQICSTRKVPEGEKIFAEGDEGDSLFIVGKGNIRIFHWVSGSYPETLAILGPGGLFGEESFIGRMARSSSAIAIEPSWIVELSRSDLNVIFSKQPLVALKVMKQLASIIATRVRATNDKISESAEWSRDVLKWAAWDLKALQESSSFFEIAVKGALKQTGKVIQIKENDKGFSILWESKAGRVHWTPSHALYYLRLPGVDTDKKDTSEAEASQSMAK